MTPLDSRRLRDVLGRYPTGVAIVTTRAADGRRVGLTINSFASLSLEPPLVLWSLVNRSPNSMVFRECRHFAINVLASDHADLAMRFASAKVADKFAEVTVHDTDEGPAAIPGSVASLICSNHGQIEAGDHRLFIGQVHRVDAGESVAPPLVFHAGRFAALAPGA